MKKYLLKRGLCPCNEFTKVVCIETPATLDAFLFKAQAYIQYEEEEAYNTARESQHQESTKSSRSKDPTRSLRGGERKKEDRSHDPQELKGPTGRFHNYTHMVSM